MPAADSLFTQTKPISSFTVREAMKGPSLRQAQGPSSSSAPTVIKSSGRSFEDIRVDKRKVGTFIIIVV